MKQGSINRCLATDSIAMGIDIDVHFPAYFAVSINRYGKCCTENGKILHGRTLSLKLEAKLDRGSG